jgi:hypothetical protein
MIGLKGAELVLGASVQFVMAVSAPKNIENSTLGLHRIEDYSPLVGVEKVERILKKAGRLRVDFVRVSRRMVNFLVKRRGFS